MPRQQPSHEADLACPSAPAVAGNSLLGIVDEQGLVRHVKTPMVISHSFIEAAAEGSLLEQRFRFTGPCVKGACRQWTGNACGVIDHVMVELAKLAPTGHHNATTTLPACTIRARCRWYSERGGDACHACIYVVTDQAGGIPG
jgi:hypothetical protein